MRLADFDQAINTECELLAAAQEKGDEMAASFHRGAIAAYASMRVRQETENAVVRMLVGQSMGVSKG